MTPSLTHPPTLFAPSNAPPKIHDDHKKADGTGHAPMMKAFVNGDPGKSASLEDRPRPIIRAPGDAIV
jgi:hypothetical protein